MNHKFYYSFRILACLVFLACAITSGINMSEKGTSTIVTVLSVILIFILLLTGGWITECSVRYLIYPWAKNIRNKWNDRDTKQKPTVLPPIFREIEEYTRTTFHQVLTPEEIDNLVNSMKLFAIDYEPDQHPAAVNRAIHRISTLDLHHFGWNIGKRLKKDNTGIAHFLKTQFPVVFKNSTEASMKKKLKSDDGRFMIDIIELDKVLSPVNLNKIIHSQA